MISEGGIIAPRYTKSVKHNFTPGVISRKNENKEKTYLASEYMVNTYGNRYGKHIW